MSNSDHTIYVHGLLANGLTVVLTDAHVIIDNHDQATDETGSVAFTNLTPGRHDVAITFFHHQTKHHQVKLEDPVITLTIDLSQEVSIEQSTDNSPFAPVGNPLLLPFGANVLLKMAWNTSFGASLGTWLSADTGQIQQLSASPADELALSGRYANTFVYTADEAGPISIAAALGNKPPQFSSTSPATLRGNTLPPQPNLVGGGMSVSLRRSSSSMTNDVPLWMLIRNGAESLSFSRYLDFMDWLFCGSDYPGVPVKYFSKLNRRALPFTDTDAYRNLKFATEAFVMGNCSVWKFDRSDISFASGQLAIDISPADLHAALAAYRSNPDIPYMLPYLVLVWNKFRDLGTKLKDVDIGDVDLSKVNKNWHSEASTCYGLLRHKLECPCLLELIWSYWQEEGMLNQTMNAITRRFQNVRGPLANDPLANTEIDPLRPLNNILWGYVQDEQHRLTVVRRNYEYDHHYGLRLAGKAVRNVHTADSRSRFLEAFHTLLSTVAAFYKRDDDTTIVADGFPVLNALKEAHLILSQGAHNQFGDLPSTARIEMLMQQWILARPEFREFLPTRLMVAYPEPWMDRVDAMKKLQNWSDTSVLHFRNLAVYGEQILLSIRYGAWADVSNHAQAVNWARYWRPEIQGYMHAYRSVTGVDLSVDVTNATIDAVMPSVHLVRRLSEQQRHSA